MQKTEGITIHLDGYDDDESNSELYAVFLLARHQNRHICLGLDLIQSNNRTNSLWFKIRQNISFKQLGDP